MFVNRENEKILLKKLFSSSGFTVIYLIGRRRIGKTTLIFESLGDVPYVLLPKDVGEKAIRDHIKLSLGYESSNLSELFRLHFSDNSVLFIDEIQNLAGFPSLVSELQQGIDFLDRKGTKGLFVAAGSSISMTSQLFESGESPLYRRAHARLSLPELPLKDTLLWGKKISGNFEQALTLYLTFGGIPYYYSISQRFFSIDVKTLVKELFFSELSLLESEVEAVLSSEFKGRHSIYRDIIYAVGRGKTRESEIASFLEVKQTTLHKYINFLETYGFLGRVRHIDKKIKSLYIKDPVLNLLFSCRKDNFKNCFEVFSGGRFEETIRGNINLFSPFHIEDFGKYVGKASSGENFDIDVIGINRKRREVLFAECKWNLSVDGLRVEKELKSRARLFPLMKGNRKEHYAIFARAFRSLPHEAMAISLPELEKAFLR